MGGSSKRVTVGYKYYLGVHFALCHGVVDALLKIRVDKRIAIEKTHVTGSLYINNPNLFGGEKREGGIVGTVDFMNGTKTQGVNSYLSSRLSAPVPAFRGICSLVMRQVYIGVNPYLKNWFPTVTRINKKTDGSSQWLPAYSRINTIDNYYIMSGSFYIAVDSSNSMGTSGRMVAVKSILNDFLDKLLLVKNDRGSPSFDVQIVTFNEVGSLASLQRDISSTNLASIRTFISAIGSSGSNGYPFADDHLSSFLAGCPEGYVNHFMIMTDLDSSDSNFTALSNNVINNFPTLNWRHGIGISSDNTQWIDQIDNTNGSSNIDVSNIDYNLIYNEAIAYNFIGGDMNPSHIIRECLTDTTWGAGYSESEIGESFEESAQTLHSEKFGLSLLWSKQTPIEDFINSILQSIAGTLYISRTTGKWELTLARADYDINDLFVIDENIINRVTNFKRKAPSEFINQVTVQFDDYSTGEKNSVTVQNISLIQQFGTVISETYEYVGISNAELATKLATRELKELSQPLIGCTIYATREASFLNVGEVFILSYARSGVSEVVMRVVKLDLGSFDQGTVKIDCIQDVFGASETVYAPSEGGEWENPATDPVDLTFPLIYEAPYYELAQIVGDDDAQAIPPHSGYVVLSGVAPSGDSFNMSIYNNIGLDYEEAGTADFCPSGVLVDICGYLTDILLIDGVVDIDVVQTGTYALLGVEIVRIDSLPILTSDGYELTIARGCLDTVRIEHPIGTRIYFADVYVGSDQVEYVDSETPNFKLTPITSKGELLVEDATPISITMNSRKDRPYPPAKVQINGVSYPDTILATEDLVLTWVERNRLQQTASIVDDLEGTITPEANVRYHFELYNSINVLIHSHYNITATSSTVTIGQLGTDYGILRIVLWCDRDDGSETFESWQRHDFTIERLT